MVYGAGQRGSALGKFIEDYVGIRVEFVVSDGRSKEQLDGHKIYYLSEIVNDKEKYHVFVAVASAEVRHNLKKCNIDYIDIPNYCFPFLKEYARLLSLKVLKKVE